MGYFYNMEKYELCFLNCILMLAVELQSAFCSYHGHLDIPKISIPNSGMQNWFCVLVSVYTVSFAFYMNNATFIILKMSVFIIYFH